ncbi:uncharacterized protein LOC100891346 [Strongylocentrotus purpuratus]|uniref:FAM194 C-terminal domain-containing protein n=1 Tax=Strongylocentrotus purpuratus TaxID=7668 RepID=A0A7M7HNN4_STRPU|nr:uncharacterized protein LOC100891346 [Strongylocentrotus purpuratus]XP_030856206.1 uncharacterized protein LOC100891346 [Strongylocentrotus purpuratus]
MMFGPVHHIPSPYFFDQKQVIQRPKRRRKQPQELPRSLRFANLNPRLAAFLSSQERQKKKQLEAESSGGFFSSDQTSFLKYSEEAGNSFFALQNTELYRQIFRNSFDNLTLDGEQTQRQLYHESVQAAPTLLVKLTSILYLFVDQHLDLPRELVNSLSCAYEELTAEAQFEKKEWQCIENLPDDEEKEVGEDGLEEDKDLEDGAVAEDVDGKEKKKKKKKKSSGEDQNQSPADGSHVPKSKLGKDIPPGTAKSAPPGRSLSKTGRDGRLSLLKITPGLGRRAHTADISGESQDGGGVNQPSFLQVISFSITKAKEETGWLIQPEDQDDAVRRSILETIIMRLNQSSQEAKVAMFEAKEKGHTHPLSKRYYGDSKREALAKYLSTSKKPTTVAVAPRLSSTSMQRLPPPPKLPQPAPQELRPKFMTGLPDGSVTLYYPSGRVAILTSPSGEHRVGHYTHVYEDDEENSYLAAFTPTGRGCICDEKGTIRLWCTEKGGMIADEDGALTTKWEWPLPHLRLHNPVSYKVNDHITFRCVNRAGVSLTFTCHKETAKIHIGQTIMATEPQTQEEMGYLMLPEDTYTSAAASESHAPPPPPPKRKKPKDVNVLKRVPKPKIVINPMEEIMKTLELPNIGEHGIQAEKELDTLKTRARYLLDEWMDHYRMMLNVTNPQLARVGSAVIATRHRTRLIKSAKPMLESGPDRPQSAAAMDFLPRPKLPMRAPSAPAVGRLHVSRPYSTMSMPSEQPKKDESQGRQSRVRIEVDGVDQGYYSRYSRGGSTLSRTTRVSSPQRMMSGKTSIVETEASGDKARRSAPSIGCPAVLRAEMLGDTAGTCKCSRHRIPVITDLELDKFLTTQVPREQLMVLCVVSSMFPGAMPCGDMLVRLYETMNRNRTKPCYQCRGDRYRLLIYDTIAAVQGTTNKQPELYRRHNAVPGMFMIYGGGKLLFCDHIFNGYGNARKDFQKQLSRTLKEHNMGHFLPRDFRFSASRGKHGPRSAWGGEIGGPYRQSRKEGVALPGLEDHTTGVVQSASVSSLGSSKGHSFSSVILPPRPHTSGRYVQTRAESVMRRLPPTSHLVA